MAEERNYTQERLDRTVPAAKALFKLIADNLDNLKVGEIKDEDRNGYVQFSKQVIKSMMDANLNFADRYFVFQLLTQIVEMCKDATINNIEGGYNLATEILWGKDINDLTLVDVDLMLKKPQGTA
jgi:hypothetical protein